MNTPERHAIVYQMSGPWNQAMRYLLAVGSVALGMGLRMALERWVGPGLPTYITFYPAVMVAALLGGLGPGLTTTALAALTTGWWILPPEGIAVSSPVDRMGLALFMCMSAFMSIVVELYRRNRDKAKTYELEKAMYHERKQTQNIIDNTTAIVYAFDLEERFVLANAASARLLNSTPARMLGKRRHDFMPQADADWHEANDREVIDAGRALDFEEQSEISGRATTWLTTKFPLRDADDKIYAVGGISTDITARKRAEELLQHNSRLLTNILESISDAFFALDPNLVVTYFNSAAARLLNKKAEEVVGQQLFDAFPEARGSIFEENYTRALREKVPLTFEAYFPVKPYENWYDVRVYPQENGISVYFQVTTERKRAEEDLQKSNAFNQSIIDSSNDCIKILNMDGRLQYMNPPGQRLLEINDFNKYFNVPYENFWKGSDHTRVIDVIEKAKLGQSGSFQGYCPTAGGTPKWWDVSISPILGADGKPDRLLAISRDITERRNAEEALRESEERYKSLVEQAVDGIFLSDAQGRYIDVNTSGARMLGYTREELFRLSITDVISPADMARMSAQMSALAGGSVVTNELQFHRKDGSAFPGEVVGRKMPDGCLLGILRDITERKRVEEELLNMSSDLAARNRELESLNRELDAYTYSVSHDLRAPLRSVTGFAKMVIEDYSDKLDAQGKDYLFRIFNGSEKMNRLINDLLRLSRVSRQDIVRGGVDLSAVAAVLVKELREADPERKVQVEIKDGLTVSADHDLMKIALENLIANAWKFTSKNAEARIEIGSTEKDGKTIYHIKDNGAGFDPAYADGMFAPFRRLHTDKEFEGTGIGLAIVERIINKHGGKVWAEGQVGKGATVFFTLGNKTGNT